MIDSLIAKRQITQVAVAAAKLAVASTEEALDELVNGIKKRLVDAGKAGTNETARTINFAVAVARSRKVKKLRKRLELEKMALAVAEADFDAARKRLDAAIVRK